ncbi:hypothetical protein ABK040_003219 [Willaertia magna]
MKLTLIFCVFFWFVVLLLLVNSVQCISLFAIPQLLEKQNGLQLVSINDKSGNITNVGPVFNELAPQQTGSLDKKNGIYYTINLNQTSQLYQLIGLSLKNGLIVKNIKTPLTKSILSCGCVVNQNDGNVFIYGTQDSYTVVYNVNTNNGQYELLLKQGNISPLSVSTFDYNSNMLWILFEQKRMINKKEFKKYFFLVIDTTSGEIVIQVDDFYQMQTLAYDDKVFRMIGIGSKEDNQGNKRLVLVAIDLDTFEVEEMGLIDENFQQVNTGGALDVNNELIYSVMSNSNTNEIVAINYKSKSVMYKAKVGKTFFQSLQLYP